MSVLDTLNHALKYEPETGVFRWKNPTGSRVKSGSVAGSPHNDGYRKVKVDGKEYLEHRLAWFLTHRHWPEADIDHINGNRSDNRLCNLREATRTQNRANSKISSSNRTGVKGVWWYKQTSRWVAGIKLNGEKFHLGYFLSKEEACEAYRKAAADKFAEFAKFSEREA